MEDPSAMSAAVTVYSICGSPRSRATTAVIIFVMLAISRSSSGFCS